MDLPGYGYAGRYRLPAKKRMGVSYEHYYAGEKHSKAFILESRGQALPRLDTGDLEPKRRAWRIFNGHPYIVVAIKIDKLNQAEQQRGTEGHQAICRAAAVLGRDRPGSEGNLASDNDNIPTSIPNIDTPPLEASAEKTAAPEKTSGEKTGDEAAPKPHRSSRSAHRPAEKQEAKAEVKPEVKPEAKVEAAPVAEAFQANPEASAPPVALDHEQPWCGTVMVKHGASSLGGKPGNKPGDTPGNSSKRFG